MKHIHYEDHNTNYICLGPVSKVLNMVCCWVEDQNSVEFKRHPSRIKDYLWLAEDGMKMQGNMATIRDLKIKTGTCKRIIKELHSYEKEVEREAAKTADMKEKGADPYDLKQQENVLGESRMMVPDCRKRLETSVADLKATLVDMEDNGEKEGPEIEEAEIEEARSIIADADQLFQVRDD